MTVKGSTVGTIAVVWAAALALGACDAPPEPADDTAPVLLVEERDGLVFMRQNVEPAVTMEALFEGRVTVDAEGCPRLDTPDAPAVVWPRDHEVAVEGGEVTILDGEGAAVGTLGGTFSLAGGEVPLLSDDMGFTADDRARAEERCPGKYWIAA
jgi:hypothetical protein